MSEWVRRRAGIKSQHCVQYNIHTHTFIPADRPTTTESSESTNKKTGVRRNNRVARRAAAAGLGFVFWWAVGECYCWIGERLCRLHYASHRTDITISGNLTYRTWAHIAASDGGGVQGARSSEENKQTKIFQCMIFTPWLSCCIIMTVGEEGSDIRNYSDLFEKVRA